MAIADYFHKNAMAASQILQHFDNVGFESVLSRQCVALAFDGKAASSFEAKAAADLAIRLIARFYPRVSVVPLDTEASEMAKQLETLAREINPKISLVAKLTAATVAIALGETKLELPKSGAKVFYIGSRGWTALLSSSKPVGSGGTQNPFGSGVAACFGVANVFCTVFRKQLPDKLRPSENIKFSVIEYKTGRAAKAPALRTVSLGAACLVGAGAIGNGAIWALRRMSVKGSLTLVDPQDIELSNIQRYVLTTRQDEFHPKVEVAERWFSGLKGFSLVPKKMSWDEFAHKSEWTFDRVAVALDSAKDRIGVQASLPRWIVNAWTLGSAIGISRHPSFDGDACLACLYLPGEVVPSEDFLVASSLGFSTVPQNPDLMDVRRRLDLNVPNERTYLDRIAAIKGVPITELLPFENKSLRSLYTEGVCGGQIMGLVQNGEETQAEVPMAFQSAMAGVLLAAELVIDAAGIRSEPIPTISRIDLLRELPDYISARRAKDSGGRCLCQDRDYQEVYAEKYG